MWTATITGLTSSGETLDADVLLTDGTQKLLRKFPTDGTLASLRPQLLATVARLDARAEKSQDLALKQIIELVADIPVNEEPSSETVARRAFEDAYGPLRQLQRGVSMGLVAA